MLENVVRVVAERETATMDDDDTRLGWQTTVVRRGDVVHRSASPGSRSVLDLLRHLEHRGCSGSPRVIGDGFDVDGHETLSYISGESPHPWPWSDEGLHQLAVLIRDLHRSAADFEPTSDARWNGCLVRTRGDASLGFGHGDLGPWNVMAVDGLPVGVIDWDTAGPIDPVWDLAHAAWLNVQLHDDDIAVRVGLSGVHERAQQLSVLLDGYGLEAAARVGFIDKMIELAVLDATLQAVDHEVTPETTAGVADDGYPFAWGMAWRIRSANWMLANRSALESAISS